MSGPVIVRYDRPRPVSDWIEDGHPVPGHELGGIALRPEVLAAYGASIASRQPCEYLVIGEERHPDGRWHLLMGANREYIEAVTDYSDQAGHLVLTCPDCGKRGGKHVKGCEATR